jgi:serine/threonine protein kinase
MQRYNTPFPEEIVQHLMKQIVRAVAYFHEFNVIHRDLKLDNIMVNFDSEKDKQDLNMMRAKIKIIDFGVSKTEAKATTIAGTPNYMDPVILIKHANKEKIDELRPYSQEVDIWSLGCICYTLFTGEILFKGDNAKIILEQVQKETYQIPIPVSPELKDFLSRMLQHNGEYRSKASELLNHPFLIKKAKNFGKAQINPPINFPVNVWKNSNYSSQTNIDIDMPNNIQLGTESIGTINLGTVPIETQDQYDNPNTIKNTGSNGLSYYNDFMTTTNSETNMKTADVQSGQNMFPQFGGSYISVDQIPEENNNNGIPQF